jgi:precorrin-6A/cobalt-precorrin-6A reductase
MKILLLGGTAEASLLATALHDAGFDAVFSYAGRTNDPALQPLPMRIGGFGGVPGLQEYLAAENITHVIDATHPFAAQMSWNAHAATSALGLPLMAFERSAWQPLKVDNWIHVADNAGALAALPNMPARVFLAIGKQGLDDFAAATQHHFLLRLVDRPEIKPLPNCTVVIAKGPFDVVSDTALLQKHAITHVIAKNAGGKGASAKLAAARALGLPVIMIARPALPDLGPDRARAESVAAVIAWLDHFTA